MQPAINNVIETHETEDRRIEFWWHGWFSKRDGRIGVTGIGDSRRGKSEDRRQKMITDKNETRDQRYEVGEERGKNEYGRWGMRFTEWRLTNSLNEVVAVCHSRHIQEIHRTSFSFRRQFSPVYLLVLKIYKCFGFLNKNDCYTKKLIFFYFLFVLEIKGTVQSN